MNKTSIQKIFTGIFLIACIILGVNKFTSDEYAILNFETGTGSSSRMTYGRFLEYLEMGWVNQVDLYDNGRNAIVQASSPELGSRPQSIRVEIPIGASQLIQKLKDSNIDFDAHPTQKQNLLTSIASNLILPFIFISGLIFLFGKNENSSQN